MSVATTTDVVASEVLEADRTHLMHGFAPLGRGAEPGPIFREARGIHMTDLEGNDWLDACAGLANIGLGYGRDELADVAAEAHEAAQLRDAPSTTTAATSREPSWPNEAGRDHARRDSTSSSTRSADPTRSRRRSSSRASSTPSMAAPRSTTSSVASAATTASPTGRSSLAGDPLMVENMRSPARGVLPHRAAPQRRDR